MTDSRNYWAKVDLSRVSRRRLLAGTASLGLGATAAALIGCGGSSSGGGGATGQKGGSGGTPVMGGKITVGFTLDPGTLDPHIGTSGGDGPFVLTMFDSLTRLNAQFVPDPALGLAEKWEVIDPTHINFKLRQPVQFHDGSAFNADVVKWNIERIQDPATKAANRGQLASITKVESVDASTSRFVLAEPNAALFDSIASYRVAMIPPAAYEKLGKEFGGKPIGTGPFQFVEWLPGTHMKVKRFPNYWQKDSAGRQMPYFDEAVIGNIPDDTVRLANVQTAQVDVIPVVPKDVAQARGDSNLVVYQGIEGNGPSCPIFNLDKAPLNDKRLRRAIMHSLDAAPVVKLVYFNFGEPVTDNLWPRKAWFGGVKIAQRPNYDLAQAKAQLSAAGMPDGFSFNMITYQAPQLIQQTEIYQEQMSKVGIKATITTQDVSTATTSFFTNGQFPLYSTFFGTSVSEPHITCALVFQGTSFYNPMHRPINQELEDLIKKGAQTYDRDQRKSIYTRIAEIDMDEAFFMPMVYTAGFTAWRNNITAENMEDVGRFFLYNRLEALWRKA